MTLLATMIARSLRRTIYLVATGLLLLAGDTVRGDSVDLELEVNSIALQWELYAQVVTTESGSSGEYGLAAVRALIDNVPLNTVTLASGLGAINPIDAGGPNERPAAVATNGGTIDLIYLQNLAAPATVVEGVGVGSRQLIASGSYLNAAVPPSFGDDDFGYTSDGNFLNRTAPSTYGAAFPWDAVTLAVLDVTPPGINGDYNNDGMVNLADYTVWRDRLGAPAGSLDNDPHSTTIGTLQYDTWKANFGLQLPPGAIRSSTVPEPTNVVMALTALLLSALPRVCRIRQVPNSAWVRLPAGCQGVRLSW